ncbi:MAG: tetratricopeptide repeat protein [Deltaproteobacteria bacterium]|nr:tetratricopeptide repeat protein [Deltaproteobacteria bacterium]
MKRVISITLLTIAVLLAFQAHAEEEWLKKGLTYLESRDHERAIKAFSKAIEANPQEATAYCNRAVAWFFLGDYAEAMADFNKALEINPHYTEALCNRGFIWTKKGDYGRAIRDYTKAIETDPSFAEAYTSRAVAWFFSGKYTKAIADCNKALKIKPRNAEAYATRGAAWSEKGDYRRAIDDYTKAVEISPQNAEAFSNRGFVWTKQGNYERAIEDYTRALEINPRYPEALRQMAWTLATCPEEKYRNGSKAVKIAKKAVQFDGGRGSFSVLAAAHAEAGNFSEAVAAQKKGIALFPKNGDANERSVYEERLMAYENRRPWRMAGMKRPSTRVVLEKEAKRPSSYQKKKKDETWRKKAAPAHSTPPRVKATPRAATKVFAIQVGAFLSRENAEKKRGQLRRLGYDSRVLTMTDDKGRTWHRVLVGEFASRKQAKQGARILSEDDNIPSFVYTIHAP